MFDPFKLSFDMVFMCKTGVKYQTEYVSRVVCPNEYLFWKRPRCALLVACALIRTNMVHLTMGLVVSNMPNLQV